MVLPPNPRSYLVMPVFPSYGLNGCTPTSAESDPPSLTHPPCCTWQIKYSGTKYNLNDDDAPPWPAKRQSFNFAHVTLFGRGGFTLPPPTPAGTKVRSTGQTSKESNLASPKEGSWRVPPIRRQGPGRGRPSPRVPAGGPAGPVAAAVPPVGRAAWRQGAPQRTRDGGGSGSGSGGSTPRTWGRHAILSVDLKVSDAFER